MDVYQRQWPAPNRNPPCLDDLYIKLRLNGKCTSIVIHSFHREGAL